MNPTPETDNPPILSERQNGVLTVWLNRPHRLNAVSEGLYRDLIGVLDTVSETDRAVVLRGAGRAFCVGADLKAHHEGRTTEERHAYIHLAQDACRSIHGCPVPVLGVVHGYALGAGAEMALACDFVVMDEDAQMGFPELSLATYVGGGVTSLLPRLVGLRRARDLMFLEDRFTGADAARWGLITSSVPASALDETAETIATRLASLGPLPARAAKKQLLSWQDLGNAMELEAETLEACMATEDWAEGVQAFAEKRPPRFGGR